MTIYILELIKSLNEIILIYSCRYTGYSLNVCSAKNGLFAKRAGATV